MAYGLVGIDLEDARREERTREARRRGKRVRVLRRLHKELNLQIDEVEQELMEMGAGVSDDLV